MSVNSWIIHYNITIEALKNSFFIKKKLIHCGDGDGVGIPEPIENEDEIQFLIPVKYG